METKEKRARRNSERLSNSPTTSDLYKPYDFSEGLATYQIESGRLNPGLNSSNLYESFDDLGCLPLPESDEETQPSLSGKF